MYLTKKNKENYFGDMTFFKVTISELEIGIRKIDQCVCDVPQWSHAQEERKKRKKE